MNLKLLLRLPESLPRPNVPRPDPAALKQARDLVWAGKYDQIDDAGREALRRFHRLQDILALDSM